VTNAGPLSNQIMNAGYLAEALLIISLFTSMTSYLSLNISGARNNERILNVWLAPFGPMLIFGWVCTMASMITFFVLIHKSVNLTYPGYQSGTRGVNDGTLRWNATSDSFGERDYVKIHVNDGIIWVSSTFAMFVLTVLAGILGHGYTNFKKKAFKEAGPPSRAQPCQDESFNSIEAPVLLGQRAEESKDGSKDDRQEHHDGGINSAEGVRSSEANRVSEEPAPEASRNPDVMI